MPPSRVLIKTSLLITLVSYASQVEAQQSSSNKKKVALGSGMPMAPNMVPVRKAVPLNSSVRAAINTNLLKASYPATHMEKGYYYKQQNKPHEALLEFVRAAHENPRNTKAFYEQAQLFQAEGQTKLAKSAMEQALALAPRDTKMRTYLVQLHVQSGNLLGAANEVGKIFSSQKPPAQKITIADRKDLEAPSAAISVATTGKLPTAENSDPAAQWLHSASAPTQKVAPHTESSIDKTPSAEPASRPSGRGKISLVFSQSPSTKSNGPGAFFKDEPRQSNASEKAPEQVSEARNEQRPKAIDDIINNLGAAPKAEKHEQKDSKAETEEFGKLTPNSVSDALKNTPSEKNDKKDSRVAAQNEDAQGLLARMRTGASRAVSNIPKPPMPEWIKSRLPAQAQQETAHTEQKEEKGSMFAWMKDKLPFGADKPAQAPPAPEEKKVSRAANMLSHIKDHIPFTERAEDAAVVKNAPHAVNPIDLVPKQEKPFSIGSVAQNMKSHIPFIKHETTPSNKVNVTTTTNTTTTVTSSYQKSLPDKADLPPEVARILDGRYGGDVNVTTSKTAAKPAEKSPDMDPQLKQILSAVPKLPEDNRVVKRPEVSGPNYGLLKNNSVTHLASTDLPEMDEADKKPGFFENMMSQAKKTFTSFVPNVSWSWPSLPGLPGTNRDNSPEAIVANVSPETAPVATGPGAVPEQKAPTPVPLDVSRIINSFSSPTAPAPPPVAVRLSASLPIAAAPSTLESMIPKPVEHKSAAETALPQLGAQGLERKSATAGPLTSPEQGPLQPLIAALPPAVQDAVASAQPVLKPALDAASGIAQAISPLAIPKSEIASPVPLETASQNTVPNKVPVPVGVDMSKYYPGGLSAGPANKIIDFQKSKSGAFTFMKPLIDGDKQFLSSKQVRTIRPVPGKMQEPVAEPPEDPVTKRMRYLMEHGTGNLKRGEAFMFSESTGEGTLFLSDGTTERRKLQESKDSEKVLRERRPDIMKPKDLQYSLNLLGKLLPAQAEPHRQQSEPMQGPSLEQLLQQMEQQKKGFFGWVKKGFGMSN